MNTGKTVRIHTNVPEPIILPRPEPKRNEPIPVRNWPTKQPVKAPANDPAKVESDFWECAAVDSYPYSPAQN